MVGKQENIETFFYERYIDTVNRGLVGKISNFLHKLLELNLGKIDNENSFRIVEMGAGHGQHFNYVQKTYSEYLEVDLRPRSLQNFTKHRPGEPTQVSENRSFIQSDCSALPFLKDDSVDRVIATCLLVHLIDPEKALIEWRRITKPGGLISLWVALEPSIFLRFLQKITTKRKYEKFGFPYYSIHYREHIQHYPRMRMIINEVFVNDTIRRIRFPFPFLWWHLNLVEIYQIRIAKR